MNLDGPNCLYEQVIWVLISIFCVCVEPKFLSFFITLKPSRPEEPNPGDECTPRVAIRFKGPGYCPVSSAPVMAFSTFALISFAFLVACIA